MTIRARQTVIMQIIPDQWLELVFQFSFKLLFVFFLMQFRLLIVSRLGIFCAWTSLMARRSNLARDSWDPETTAARTGQYSAFLLGIRFASTS